MTGIMSNACKGCRTRKRRCDRARPRCETCVRTSRVCLYEEDAERLLPNIRSSPSTASQSLHFSAARQLPGGYYEIPDTRLDPIQHEDLRASTVDLIVRQEVLKVLGSLDRISEIAERYFQTVHHRVTILWKTRFMERLTTLRNKASASYLALSLCMHLLQQQPNDHVESMRTSLYVTAKSVMSILAATGMNSLDIVQSLVLINFYEIGHGIYPAASMSVAVCAKLARSLGLHKEMAFRINDRTNRMEIEEQKRVWWLVVNLERYINLCDGDALFGTEDPRSDSLLPVEDSKWAEGIDDPDHNATLATPSDITVGQLARECQVAHLAGRVVRHVFDPTSDPRFQAEESRQLERTLKAFLPLLVEEHRQFSKYCCSIGICSSALFTLYHVAPTRSGDEHTSEYWQHAAMEPLSTQMAMLTEEFFGNPDTIEFETLSPLATYCIYQSAVVQLAQWQRTGEIEYKHRLESLKGVLALFNRRWRVAGRYLRALEVQQPQMMVPSAGFPLSG